MQTFWRDMLDSRERSRALRSMLRRDRDRSGKSVSGFNFKRFTDSYQVAGLASATFAGWWNDRALSMGAAIAFYAIFSLAPVLLIAIAVGGLVFGADAARHAVLIQFGGLIGPAGADAIDKILTSASNIGSGVIGTLIGLATFLVTATGAFVELQADLNIIWKAKAPAYSGFLAAVYSRLMSLALIAAISFLLMISLTFDALASAAGQYISLQGWVFAIAIVNLIFSVAMSALLFAFIFKVLPSAPVSWSYVIPGAILTAVLFVMGKFVIGFYLGRSNIASSYGAAASVITLMLWVYYSTQILLFGAEFTKAYAERSKRAMARRIR
jgi:membrane protein